MTISGGMLVAHELAHVLQPADNPTIQQISRNYSKQSFFGLNIKSADPDIPLGIPEVITLTEDAKKRLAGLRNQ